MGMTVAIRADASVAIGTGHLMRCLTLANELRRLGGSCLFICRQITETMRARILDDGHALAMLPPRDDAPDDDLPHAAWLGVSQAGDAADSLGIMQTHGPFDWLITDHYGLDARWENAVRPAVAHILVLDDLADRPHAADILLDQNLQSQPGNRYAGLSPDSCRHLVGPRYALLRPEFRALAAQSPAKERLNVFFGGTDPAGMTVRALEGLLASGLQYVPADIIAGQDNPHIARITALMQNLPAAQLHTQPSDFSAIMSRAKLALGAGGTTSWERCCLGLPTLIVSIAENQRAGTEALAKAGAAIDMGDMHSVFSGDIARALQDMLAHPARLATMGAAARELVDGRGTERVALAMMGHEISLRLADAGDCDKAWTWRNAPAVRTQSFDTAPLAREQHVTWWQAALADPDRILLIAHCGPIDVGVLRFDVQADQATVSIYLDPGLTGLGAGRHILDAGRTWLQRNKPQVRKLCASIKPYNQPSIRSFASTGYHHDPVRNAWFLNLEDVYDASSGRNQT